jgi:hypothetical protein
MCTVAGVVVYAGMPVHGLCWLLLLGQMRIKCEFVDKRQKLGFRIFSQYVISNTKRNVTVETPTDITPVMLVLNVI